MITPVHRLASSLTPASNSEDGQRYFELSRPFLSHASPRYPARTHAMKEPRPTPPGGQPQRERPAGHLTRACAGPGRLERHK
jgi:hypothetical protein